MSILNKLSTPVFLLSMCLGGNALANCEEAGQHYNNSLTLAKQARWDQALAAASESTRLCNRFNNWYLKGQIEQEKGNHTAANASYENAQQYSETSTQRSLAIGRYAESLFKLGKTAKAQTLIQEARKASTETPEWIETLAIEIDEAMMGKPFSANALVAALDTKAFRSLDINATPAVSMQLNFKKESTELITSDTFDPQVLAIALMDDSLKDQTFTIIGHTDTMGTNSYNEELSVARAKAIYQSIVAIEPNLVDRIRVVGKGESTPRYIERSEKERQLNRRVEFGLK